MVRGEGLKFEGGGTCPMSVFVPYSILWGVVKFEGGGICPISVWKFLGGGFEVSGKMFGRVPHQKNRTWWEGRF